MYKALVPLLGLALLAACSAGTNAPSASNPGPSNAAPAPAAPAPASTSAPSNNDVRAKLQELAGKGASDCGDVMAMSSEELKKASDCATAAAKAKKPFTVSYDMPGLSVGVAGNSEGKLFTVQSEEENGKPAAPKSQPCPAELRIAQSGRVTCMPVGSMGVAPGSGNPHGGASPHGGGMAMPPAGTANPHGTSPTKSH